MEAILQSLCKEEVDIFDKTAQRFEPDNVLNIYSESHKNKPDVFSKIVHGTTTLAFRFSGGILVAVDSRATAGSWIASQTVKKVIEINDYLLGTMAGGAADCQFWETFLSMECRLYELRNKARISVAAASKILSNILYSYKGMGLSMGVMLCGWDVRRGSSLFYVDSEGTRLKGDLFCVGSGSTFAYSVLDAEYCWDMTIDDAIALGKRSILAATHRDAFSGGSVLVYLVTSTGWQRYGPFDIATLFDEIATKDNSFQHVLR